MHKPYVFAIELNNIPYIAKTGIKEWWIRLYLSHWFFFRKLGMYFESIRLGDVSHITIDPCLETLEEMSVI